MKPRSIYFSALYHIEEFADGWWFRPISSKWVGPFPSFDAMSKQIGNRIERVLKREYQARCKKTPR
jgi:hypothetical protein